MIRPVRPDGTIETGGVFVPIQRRRVIQRIASAAMQRVVLIVAPAGYGKSVALRQYLETTSEPTIRFDVLPDNATLLGFLRGFADAISAVAPDARTTLAGAYEKNAESANAGTDLAMWMHAHLKSFRGTVAIDDLHIAQEDREVTRFLASLIERTKGGVQWIIASRSTQGLPIGTWLAYGESDLAIDEHDLKFSAEEAKEAARSFRLGVRDDELYELLNLTDGWATAMSFALRSSTRSVDLRSISSLTREMTYRYLAEQVYAALSDGERAFLETAALLPEIDLEVMVASGYDRAAALTQRLRESTAFIQEPVPGAYRLHDLFRDFVLRERELRGETESRAIGISLGAALEGLGRVVPALRLYIDNQDRVSVLRLLETHGAELITRGFVNELEATLSADLGPQFESEAVVAGLRGLIQMIHGRFAEGERLVTRSLETLGESTLKNELLLRVASHRVNEGRDALDILEGALSSGELEPTVHLETEAYLAVCHARFGRVESALRASERVENSLACADGGDALARVLLRLGTVRSLLHQYDDAKPFLSQAAEIAVERGLWSVASKARLSMSVAILFGDGDSTLSLWNAQRAAEAATRAGDFYDLQNALLAILSLETRAGHGDRAVQVEKQLAELRMNETQRASFIVSSQAHRHAWAGRFDDAHRMFGSVLDRQRYAPERALIYAMHAFCLAMDNQPTAAAGSVERAIDIIGIDRKAPAAGGLLQLKIAACFVVIAEVVAGRMTSAQRTFNREKAGDDPVGRAMHDIVEKIVRAGRAPSYQLEGVDADLAMMRGRGYGGYAEHLCNALSRITSKVEMEPGDELTPSELRMIRSLASGLAPKDIAAEMGRSEQTVRTHIKRLIRKLRCHGKAEAVVAARQMGLLGEGS